jgi:hypothetical protein
LVDLANAHLFDRLHKPRFDTEISKALREFTHEGFEFRILKRSEIPLLATFLARQSKDRLRYFNPHKFDLKTLEQMLKNPAFLMFGVFKNDGLIGYFFLRCFWNRKCFVGRLIDQPFEGLGIGRVMNTIMYNTAWHSGFRCFTTVSKKNDAVMRSHRNNPHAVLVDNLGNDYVLVEFRANPPKNCLSNL